MAKAIVNRTTSKTAAPSLTPTTAPPAAPTIPTDPELRTVIAEADKLIEETSGLPAAPEGRRISFLADDIDSIQVAIAGAVSVLAMCSDKCDEICDAIVLVQNTLESINSRLDESEPVRAAS
jgi:hypothetical protein